MALEVVELSQSLCNKTSINIEVLGDQFILITLSFHLTPIKKGYSGRCNWRYYGKAEPLTFYLDKQLVESDDRALSLLAPSEITFFVTEIQASVDDHRQASYAEEQGFPLFKVVESTIMSDGFSFEERGTLTTDFQQGILSCTLDDKTFDRIVYVSDSLGITLNQNRFTGVLLKLNEEHLLTLANSGLI